MLGSIRAMFSASCATVPGSIPSGQRRSQRVIADIPIIVSAESPAGRVSEETDTVIVSAHGALIAKADVALGQQVLIRHGTTFEQETCRVVFVGDPVKETKPVGISS